MALIQTTADDNTKPRVVRPHSSEIEERMACGEAIEAGQIPDTLFDATDMPQEILDMLGVTE